MNIERMEHLITVLEGVERAKMAFDMTVWMGESDEETTDNIEACGTACCAMGYAALGPVFNSQGLTLRAFCKSYKDENGRDISDFGSRTLWSRPLRSIADFNRALKDTQQNEDAFMNALPVYEGKNMFEAAQEFFGISQKASFYLFDPDFYTSIDRRRPISAGEVIERVREVIALNGYAPERAGMVEDDEED